MNKSKDIIDKLEEKPSEISIEKLQPILKQDIKILEYALLPLEFWCLKLAFINKSPMSTGDYYNKHIYATFENWMHKKGLLNPNQMLHDPESIKLRKMEKNLRDLNIKFSSYKKINSTLINLENYGLLVSREEKGSKANAYWFINPQFLFKYGSLFEKAFV